MLTGKLDNKTGDVFIIPAGIVYKTTYRLQNCLRHGIMTITGWNRCNLLGAIKRDGLHSFWCQLVAQIYIRKGVVL